MTTVTLKQVVSFYKECSIKVDSSKVRTIKQYENNCSFIVFENYSGIIVKGSPDQIRKELKLDD